MTETRTYVCLPRLEAVGGFLNLRQRYTGIVQPHGHLLVLAVGAPLATGALVTREEWEKWFVK